MDNKRKLLQTSNNNKMMSSKNTKTCLNSSAKYIHQAESDDDGIFNSIDMKKTTFNQARSSNILAQTFPSSPLSSESNNNVLNQCITFEVLTPDQVMKYMIEYIQNVNQFIPLPLINIRILLHFFKWNEKDLTERFYDGDLETFFKETLIVNPINKNINV